MIRRRWKDVFRSPEQIANRITLDFPFDAGLIVISTGGSPTVSWGIGAVRADGA